MNKRTRSQIIDGVLAVGMALLLLTVQKPLQIEGAISPIFLSLIPLMWLGFRHGSPLAVLGATLTGLFEGGIRLGWDEGLEIIGEAILPLLAVALVGFFAKYTQKTLNNRRLSSTYLNIATGSLLASLAYFCLRFVVAPLAMGQAVSFNWKGWQDWVTVLMTWLMAAAVLSIMARLKPSWIIPRRSKYLSRKETSSLLND